MPMVQAHEKGYTLSFFLTPISSEVQNRKFDVLRLELFYALRVSKIKKKYYHYYYHYVKPSPESEIHSKCGSKNN